MPETTPFSLRPCETSSLLSLVPNALAVITGSQAGRQLTSGKTAFLLPGSAQDRKGLDPAPEQCAAQPGLRGPRLVWARGSWGGTEEDGEERAAEGGGETTPGDGLRCGGVAAAGSRGKESVAALLTATSSPPSSRTLS